MRGHEAVARALADAGVEAMFGVIGDANMYVVADYIALGLGSYHPAVTESGACSMAQGFTRVSGQVGVATVTHGPAAANCVNAVTDAARAHVPMLLMTGSTPSTAPHHMQRVDLVDLFLASGARHRRVEMVDGLVTGVAEAVELAVSSRGPVILDVPSDLLFQDVVGVRTHEDTVAASRAAADEPLDLDQALGRLASANRPLVLAGRGAMDSGAGPVLVELADLLGAPLATTAGAKDLFHGHPYNLGIMGSHGIPRCVDIMTKADCVISFGAGLNNHTTYKGEILRGSAVIQCDDDPEAFGQYLTPDIAVQGDALAIARAMVEQIREAELPPSSFRAGHMATTEDVRAPRDEYTDRSADGFLDIRTAMVVLDEMLPVQRQVVTDGGKFLSAPWRYLHTDNPRSFVPTVGFGSIGLGIPAAIGAAVARPDVLTVCVAGDGGGMMGLIEFWSAVRLDLPFLLVVLNNSAYGEEYAKLRDAGQDPATCFASWPSFESMGQAMGAHGVTVESEQQLIEAIEKADLTIGQLVIEVRCDPTAVYEH